MKLKSLRKRVRKTAARTAAVISGFGEKLYNGKTLRQYRGDPEGYAKHVLKIEPGLTSDQLILVKQADKGGRIFCRAGHVVGKCVAVGEKITLANGTRVLAEDLVGEEFELYTIVDGATVRVPAYANWNEYENVYKITTETGNTIIRNGEHPLWSVTDPGYRGGKKGFPGGGWKSVKDIKVNDLVAMTNILPAFGQGEMPEYEIKLLAYMIGDGGMTGNSITFTKRPGKVLDEFQECCNQIGDALLMPRRDSDGSVRTHGITADPKIARRQGDRKANRVTQLLERHGLMGKRCQHKFVPEAIFGLKKPLIRLFLSRLFATDGWASVSDTGGTEIGYSSTSERLARDVQELLLRFGIHSRVSSRQPKQGKNPLLAWGVTIRDTENLLKFALKIGIFSKEDDVNRVVAKADSAKKAKSKWRKKDALKGTHWENVVSVEKLPPRMTVAISVPQHHTYLTSFYEHNSFVMAFLVSYYYDTNEECVIVTTGPRLASVRDILWRELRSMRRRAGLGGFTGPRSLRLESSENHLAIGTTARSHTGFQGKHGLRMLFIIDEAVGVESEFWEAIETMLTGDHYALVATYNPTTTACQAYNEEKQKGSFVHTISCLNHPNIAAELKGEKPPYPSAVRLEWVVEHIKKWCDRLVPNETPRPTDFEFPPKSGKWWRPGPIAEARILGRWPTSAVNTFWSEALLQRCRELRKSINPRWKTAIGCDVARYGDDLTSIVVRRGPVVVHMESHSGWTSDQIAGRLKQLCYQYRGPQEDHEVRVFIDETGGWGTGVIDFGHAGEKRFNFEGVNASNKAADPTLHYNTRTELWASTVELARDVNVGVDLSRLSETQFQELSKQATSQKYRILPNGAIKAEEKDVTKEETGRSPDEMDALNLCFYAGGE